MGLLPPMKRIVAIAGGLVVGLALFLGVDAAISSALIPPVDSVPELVPSVQRPYEQFDHGFYALKRNFRGRDFWGAVVYDVATDEHGFRIRSDGPPKTGLSRILFLGDSFTYGVNGSWDQTFVGMYDRASSGRVLNAGVPSYSPTAYLHAYRTALREGALEPAHTVVIMLDISDVQDEISAWTEGPEHPYRISALNGRSTPSQAAMPPSTADAWLRDRLRFSFSAYKFVRYSILRVPNAAVFDQFRSAFTWSDWASLDAIPAAASGFAPQGVAAALERVRARINDITMLASHSGGKVYVAVYPWPAQLQHPSHFSWPQFARDACENRCAGVIDVVQSFQDRARSERDWYKRYYIFNDVHFNRDGNQIVFDALAQAIPPR